MITDEFIITDKKGQLKITPDKIERLVFAKYLLRQAEESKNLDRPLSSASILTLHDAVECFLQLAFEQLTGKAKPSGQLILETYTDRINEMLADSKKPQINKAFIKRINELRNQLKHSTIFIDKRNIQNLYSETEVFLIDFSDSIFNLHFEDLSILELLSNITIKGHLLQADKDFKKGLFQSSLFSVGKAFYEVEHLGNKGKYGEDILSKHHTINYLNKYAVQLSDIEPDKILKENLKEIAKDLNRIQDELHDLKKILSLSVDLNSYLKFRKTMPYVTKIVKGGTGEIEFWIPDEERGNKVDYTPKQVKFCYDFVTELALKHEQ